MPFTGMNGLGTKFTTIVRFVCMTNVSTGEDEVTSPVQLLKRFPTAGRAVMVYERPISSGAFVRLGKTAPTPFVMRINGLLSNSTMRRATWLVTAPPKFVATTV